MPSANESDLWPTCMCGQMKVAPGTRTELSGVNHGETQCFHCNSDGSPVYQPSTNDVPIQEPKQFRERKAVFVVTVIGSDPPPDWEEATLKVLQKEVRFCLGNNARVFQMEEASTPRDLINNIKAAFDDASGI